MATSTGQTRFCEKCHKVLQLTEFYKTNNLKKYPDGYLRQCKKCLTMHVDPWKPDSYLWILQEADVPYVPDKWNSLMARYAKPGQKMSGSTIIGRYFSAMKLKQFKQYRWKDNDFLRELRLKEIEDSMASDGYNPNDIAKTIDEMRQKMSIQDFSAEEPEYEPPTPSYEVINKTFPDLEPPPPQPLEEEDPYGSSIADQLTQDDLIYLRLKWGKGYKPEEWVALEQFFNDMMNSYDIQGAGQIDNLKMLCKTSLKANQLLDLGDQRIRQVPFKLFELLGNPQSYKNYSIGMNNAQVRQFKNFIDWAISSQALNTGEGSTTILYGVGCKRIRSGECATCAKIQSVLYRNIKIGRSEPK